AKQDSAARHYTPGTALQQNGDVHAAIDAFRNAIKLSPRSPEIRNTLGNALRQKGEMEAARAEFQEAARLNKLKSDNQAATFDTNTGIQRLKEGKLDEAIGFFESAIKKESGYAPAHYQ